MLDAPKTYGFRYRFADRNWALALTASSREEAEARVAAMSGAQLVSDLVDITAANLSDSLRPD